MSAFNNDTDPAINMILFFQIVQSKMLTKVLLENILEFIVFRIVKTKISKKLSMGNEYENDIYMQIVMNHFRFYSPSKLFFEVTSKDQGWSWETHEHGKRSSHTWSEVSYE